MKNKPVAYVNSMCNDCIDWKIDSMSIDGQSLYTHPAKTLTEDPLVNFKPVWIEKPELTLTDEEIKDFTVRIYNCRTGAEAHEIVLAILRKAQEK